MKYRYRPPSVKAFKQLQKLAKLRRGLVLITGIAGQVVRHQAEATVSLADSSIEGAGNGQEYNLHLRTEDVWLPWQAYRASFLAPARWETVRLPFSAFEGYRIGRRLDVEHLERIGLVAIGRAFRADLCIAKVALYRG